MKIMHLCTGYPLSYNGGITNYVRAIAETQANNGIDVVVVGGKDKNKKQYNFKYIEYDDAYVKPFTLRDNKGIIAYIKIKKILKKEKPDLVHIHMILDVDRRLYKILKKNNIKYIVSLHDYSLICPRIQMFRDNKPCEAVSAQCEHCAYFIEQTFILKKIFSILKINNKIGKLNSPNFKKMYNSSKKLLENAEVLLPVSKRVMEIYKNSNINNKYKVLHIGNITADNFKPYIRSHLIIGKDDIIKVIMLGNFSEKKGGNEFIKICRELKQINYKFYFLGRSSEKEKETMQENGVIDKGEYIQEDLPKLLKEYDVGCVLSIWEDNAPQVVMELLNNNIPVIGTSMGGIPDFIETGINGFLYNPYSEEEFKKLIENLKKMNKMQFEKMKENIKPTKTTTEHYDELKKVYEEIN